jgi:predicted nucleotide-binding protein (sugar kinase/HSP70/actin superfamily)
MGNICLAAKAFFEAAHIPYVMPEKINKQTLQNGVAMSPDEICLPFKIFMGSYADCVQKGADTILITGSCGPCRFGEYCELQMKLLKKLGVHARTIVIDAPSAIGRHELMRRIGEISEASPLSRSKKLHALKQAIHILSLADSLDEKAHWLAGYEIHSGECKNILFDCGEETEIYRCPDDMQKALERYHRQLNAVQTDMTKKPLRIALIGEIYSMIEPFANLFIEDRLMNLGVSTSRLITPSWWLKDLAVKPFGINSPNVNRAAKAYLPYNAGGHARESIGHALLCQNRNFDGAIQIYPLGCMPEIVVKAILPSIQKDRDFPILTLVVDEMTGEAGYLTRIEAFIDMLQMRRKKGVKSA